MIEFKADCGHTVRAKDEDEGKVVRCAYCGREVQVPDDANDEMDFLFGDDEAENSEDRDAKSTRGARSGRGSMPFKRRSRSTDPFAIVTKMSYVAVFLIAAIFIGKKYAWPMFNDAFLTEQKPLKVEPPASPTATPSPTVARTPGIPSRKYGLINPRLDRRGKEGVYINAVPPNARVYHRPFDDAADPNDFEWLLNPNVARINRPPYIQDLKPGVHEVVVMYAISDRQLKQYRDYGYNEFRKKVEKELGNKDHSNGADEIARLYFTPDDALDTRVVRIRDVVNIVRRYRIVVRRAEWRVLTPLFLPERCEMLELVKFLPKKKDNFGIDSTDLQEELAYYEVPREDRGFIEDILGRIGSISYGWDDGKVRSYRILKISPVDGVFTARRLQGKQRKTKRQHEQ